ncbi:YihY/virulence factor BrkB family protein [Microbacterium sp. YY-01]|uniref:YihY/virulence factor BrkB family protein n=1 Tax=Microbacterium sp. YY-01 TaxID=3421634 RepID=UPI003D1854B7
MTTATTPVEEAPHRPTKQALRYVIKRTIREFTADQCTDAAAALTYYAILAIFPAIVAFFSILGLLGQKGEATNTLLSLIDEVAPGEAAETLRGPLQQLAEAPGAGIALVFGIVVALWSASGYVGAFSRAINRIYGVAEGRPIWKLRPMQLLVTVMGVVGLAIATVSLALSGDIAQAIGDRIGASAAVQTAWSILKWPVLAVVIVLGVAVLYYFTPNVKLPKFRWVSPGALVAIIVLIAASAGFGLYVSTFANYSRTYGSLAGVIVFLLWVWIANLALLFGAELDVELERSRELQAGIAAEKTVQLPRRDTRGIDKKQEKERELWAEGQKLRPDMNL